MKLFLIGMMGSGKSFWAKQLSNQLHIDWIDLDTAIEQAENQTIQQIFETKGEPFFRHLESQTLHSLANNQNIIIATGGGTPCFNNNMQWMNEQGTTIWINEPLDILTKRLAAGKAHRPLIKNLADTQLTSFLSQKLTERTPFYSQAKFHVNSETLAKTPLKQLLNL